MGDIKRIQAYQKDMKKRVEPQKESILKTFQKAIESKRKALGEGIGSVKKEAKNIPHLMRKFLHEKFGGVKKYTGK